MATTKNRVSVGIVGAGGGGNALIRVFRYIKQIRMVGVCDISPEAPGLALARELSIPTYSSIEDMIREQSLDWLINATNTSITQRYLITRELNDIIVIDGQIAELGWKILRDFYEQMKQVKRYRYFGIKPKRFFTLAWTVIRELANSATPLQNELMNIAFYDPLTKLHSRRILFEFLEQEIRNLKRNSSSLSLIMIDIDNFKSINDRFGHSSGDGVLKNLAELLNNKQRSSDLVARYGGEEFTIVLQNTMLYQASGLAEKIRKKVEDELTDPEGSTITISLGVASLISTDQPGSNQAKILKKDMAALIDKADEALYRAKESGKNRVCTADENIVLSHE
ncbi:MAG: GGDEF domain-containing protein [bacterium]|nr:GGDEF domain-containing protein [bacterium]